MSPKREFAKVLKEVTRYAVQLGFEPGPKLKDELVWEYEQMPDSDPWDEYEECSDEFLALPRRVQARIRCLEALPFIPEPDDGCGWGLSGLVKEVERLLAIVRRNIPRAATFSETRLAVVALRRPRAPGCGVER